MRTVINGFSGWARMQQPNNESVQFVDAAITIIGTLLVAMTWAIVRH